MHRWIATPPAARSMARYGDDTHAKARQPPRDLLTNATIAKNDHRASPQALTEWRAESLFDKPLQGQRYMSRQHQHVRDSELRHRLCVAGADARHIRDQDTLACGGRNIDYIQSNAILLDEPESGVVKQRDR